MNFFHLFLYALIQFLQVVKWIIIINALLSWFLPYDNKIRIFLERVLYPIMNPFRQLTKKMSSGNLMIDFSPILAIIAIEIVQRLLRYAF